jgi:hypothetical protein
MQVRRMPEVQAPGSQGALASAQGRAMKLVGLMPVRNEDWVLSVSLRRALEWCDDVVLFLHGCADGSLTVVADAQSRVIDRLSYIVEPDECWSEMEHRQRLLAAAMAEHGATHIAIIDADEILTANVCQEAREHIETLPPETMLELPGYNLRNGLGHYHANGIWGNRWFGTAFKADPRLRWEGDRFHHREPMGVRFHRVRPIRHGQGGVLHMWGASERRLRAKHALYKIIERLRWPSKCADLIDAEYNLWRSPEDCRRMYPQQLQFAQPWLYDELPSDWLKGLDLTQLHLDAEPWQEAECRRLVELHGAAMFRGLDLFGVA